jgi:pimeloyl-ACP methyl ester carboxylesterase
MLHVVSRGAPGSTLPLLLFVHGACSSTKCWETHYLDWFAAHGASSFAFDLRGHGGSDGREQLQSFRIADYVEDLQQVMKGLPGLPVLVGHSMGGLIVQKYLERGAARAAVLLASSPTGGMLRDGLRLLARHPRAFARASASRQLHLVYQNPELVRSLLLTPDTPADVVRQCMEQLGEESWRACQDLNFVLPRPAAVKVPVLVMGGALDNMISAKSVRRTAAAYRTPCILFPRMGHMLNLEPGWEEVAGSILSWVKELPTGVQA